MFVVYDLGDTTDPVQQRPTPNRLKRVHLFLIIKQFKSISLLIFPIVLVRFLANICFLALFAILMQEF